MTCFLSSRVLRAALLSALVAPSFAQNVASPLDPTRNVTSPKLQGGLHQPLPEEYIWTVAPRSQDAKIDYVFPKLNEKIEHHYLRSSFSIAELPREATLYLAGPRWAKVFVNGQLAGEVSSDTDHPLAQHTFALPVARWLHAGKNTLAFEIVRGRGVIGFSNSPLVEQQTYGQAFVAKLLPAAEGVMAEPLVRTSASWMGATKVASGWEKPDASNAGWQPVQSLGGIESTSELFQWNADTGLYDWPGYDGISPYLARLPITASAIMSRFAGRGELLHEDVLLNGGDGFAVRLHAPVLANEEAPSIVLDFGKELNGRLELMSDSSTAARVTIQYGESAEEMNNHPFLGVNLLTIAPHATAHGPKTSFRYAKVRFVSGSEIRFRALRAEAIYYPVQYKGSFASSDELLNRIWETGAYTVHLCMQDDLWDSPKRDRGQWMGDNDVMGRVINDVFGDRQLLEQTLDHLLGPEPVHQQVNGIASYSAAWFTGVADFYRHTGDKEFLRKTQTRMMELLRVMDGELDSKPLFVNNSKLWIFIDWSPEMNGQTAEARRAMQFYYIAAYREAAWLLTELGDKAHAREYQDRAAALKQVAQRELLDPATGSFGPRWQTNAEAVLSSGADESQYPALWSSVFSKIGHTPYNGLTVTPYFTYYDIRAMAQMGHRAEALDWLRQYWGGMLAEGATSFWEGYDPDWFKGDFHGSLQADNESGYRVSLAHGWSSGATAWLMEEVLGLHVTGAGYSAVDIRPDLLGLEWAKGAEPTPRGLISVSLTRTGPSGLRTELEIPAGTVARVAVPVSKPGADVELNGKTIKGLPMEDGTRVLVTLQEPGNYVLSGK